MTDLTPDDVEDFTNGRLAADNAEVIRMLSAALAVARREVGWHVSPIKLAHEIELDGPDSRILWLPSLRVVGQPVVTEDDVLLDPAAYRKSAGDGPGLPRRAALRKRSGARWSCEYSGITVVMDHGYTEEEAADWRQAILSMVDQMSLLPVSASGENAFGQKSIRVDDVTIGYNPYAAMAEEIVFSITSIIDDYRLPSMEFI